LQNAAYEGHVEVVENLLDQGADKDKADNDGNTALHLAAENGHFEVANVLLSWGAKLDLCNNQGQTPSDIARAHDHEAVREAIENEDHRRHNHGFKRAIKTEEEQANKRQRVEE
jgi:ankyrin repeat protein